MTNNPRITNDDLAEYLRNEKLKRKGSEPRQGTTYYHQSLVDLGLENSTGRFASKPVVTGQTKAVEYPRQPEGSPWSSGADVGVEPPTGVEIDQMEPCGEYGEVQASLAASSSDPAFSQRVRSGSVGDDGGAVSPLDATEKAHPSAEQHRVGTHDLHSVASSSHSTKSPDLAENRRSSGSTPAAVVPGLAVSSSTASSERRSRPSSSSPDQPDDPPDGLEGLERRSDGTPLSGFIRRKIT